jgi:dienelactone hydrolase
MGLLQRCWLLLPVIIGLGLPLKPVQAQLVGEPLDYEIAGKTHEGYFVRNEGFGDRQPLVLLVHDWDGLGDYEQRRAQMLAEQGYATFAIDLYGKDLRPKTIEESRAASGQLYADRSTLRRRLLASLERGRQLPGIDPDRVVAIGYCFGGASVLELARSGADVDGFVSFHGGLSTPADQDYQQVKGEILILHGVDDPVAPLSEVAALGEALNAAAVPYNMELYGGVKHSFTVWGANRDSSRYDAQADRRSWQSLLTFLDRVY